MPFVCMKGIKLSTFTLQTCFGQVVKTKWTNHYGDTAIHLGMLVILLMADLSNINKDESAAD
ncbi:hypothetical protein ACTXT7_016268 [Hymenolepis weldensis]